MRSPLRFWEKNALRIEVLSGRPDMVTGGDALVRISDQHVGFGEQPFIP